MALVDVWIAAGQSNMEGLGNKNETPPLDSAVCWEFNYEADSIIPLADPGPPNTHNANTGSLLPAFAKVFTASSQRPSLFVRAARGGSALLAANAGLTGNWSPSGSLFNNAVARGLAAIAKAVGAGHTIASVNVLWHQGEADCKGNDLHLYEAAYAALLGRFRTALSQPDLKMYCARIGEVAPAYASSQGANWVFVREAQVSACANTDGMEMTYLRCVEFFDLHWMKSDNIHYTQNGYNDMGAAMGAYAAADMDFTPPVDPPDEGAPSSPASQPGILLRVADRILGSPSWSTPGEFSWVVPSGVFALPVVDVEGSGGGGGGSPTLNSRSGGGGGGGGYAQGIDIPVTPGETLTIKVGSGGAAGAVGAGAFGGTGGETGVFRGATALVRVAGAGGGKSASGETAPPGGAGGVATHGTNLTNGPAGTVGATSTTPGAGAGGAGAGPNGGAGGAAIGGSGPGNPGSPFGGGGSAGRNSGVGGAAAGGRIGVQL